MQGSAYVDGVVQLKFFLQTLFWVSLIAAAPRPVSAGGAFLQEAPRFDRLGAAQRTVHVLTVDPYRDVDWGTVWHQKGNLHTHTAVSDGQLAPQRAVDEYRQRGYGVLALTDHNRVTYPWTAFDSFSPVYTNREPAALGMLAVAGNELSSHHHALSLFTDFATTGKDLETSLGALGSNSPLARAVLCHPAMHWPGAYGPQRGFRVPLTPAFRQLTQGDFTVETWFKTSDTNRNILLGNYSAGFQGAVNLELHTDNRVRFFMYPDSGSTVDLNLSAGGLGIRVSDGVWHHVAGVRSNGVAVLYLDGLRMGQANATAAFELQGSFFFVGRDTRTGETEFTGVLDQARLWTRGLTSNEVARLANGEVPQDGNSADGLLAEYTFDLPLQSDDTAGHPDGPFHAARAEPGYRVALAPAVAQLTRGDFTVEAWFRTTDSERNILMGNFSGSYTGCLNLELSTDNRVRLYLQPPAGLGSTLSLLARPSASTRDGRWRHLAGIRRADTVYLYLDGQEVARTNNMALPFDLKGTHVYLGRDTRTDATVFDGDLAPVRLWSRGLSAEEVSRIALGDRLSTDIPTDGLVARYAPEEATLARDTAEHPAGPFHAESTAFSSRMRLFDVAGPLQLSGHSSSAANFDFTVPAPTSVPVAAAEYYAGLFRQHGSLRGMEVLNGTRPLSEYALDRELWDALLTALMPERPVWGVASDDMHSLTHLGHDAVVFLTTNLTEAAVREALDAGTFSFSTTRIRPPDGSDLVPPPRLDRVAHDVWNGKLILAATSDGMPLPESAYVWISLGKIVHIGSVFDYRAFTGTGAYVRAEMTGPGGTTYTNPFGLRVIDPVADSDRDGMPDWWELAYFQSTTSVVASASAPSGMTLGEHYIAGSDPRDPAAVFKVVSFRTDPAAPGRLRLRWPSAAGRLYAIECASEVNGEYAILDGAEALEAEPPCNEYEVPYAGPRVFYRVRVRLSE